MSRLLDLFHSQGRGRPVGGGDVIQWLLRDDFNDTLAAGSVNGTDATPGPGTRAVVDTGTLLSISGGNVVYDQQNVASDPGLWLDAVTRVAGSLAVCEITPIVNTDRLFFGWDDNQTGNLTESAIHLRADGTLSYYFNDIPEGVGAGVYTAASYKYAFVLRTSGGYVFTKGGSYSNWTLVWFSSVGNDATLYPVISTRDSQFTSDFLRVPDVTWLPTPLAYDTFTDSNGTSLDAHASDTVGPDSQAVASRSWTEVIGSVEIQSNRADSSAYVSNETISVMDVGEADVVVDVTIGSGDAGDVTGGGIALRETDATHYWIVRIQTDNTIKIFEMDGVGYTERAAAAVTINENTDYDVRAIAYGQTIDGFVDGANKITYGSAASNETETSHGIRLSTGNVPVTDSTAENFIVFARDDGYSDLDKYIA